MEEKNTPGKEKSLFPAVLSLAWPTMLEQLMHTAVQYIDTAMVGVLGTAAVAAVGSTVTVGWLVGSALSAFGIGFLSYISQALGAGDRERAKRASAQAVFAVFVTGAFFTALTLGFSPLVPSMMQIDPAIRSDAWTYFFILYTPTLFRAATIIFGLVIRAAGDTKTPLFVNIGVNVINIALNFFLIYETRTATVFGAELLIPGAGLGVAGAAAASAISVAAGGFAMTVVLFRHRIISPRGYSMKPDGEVLRPCVRVAAPNMAQRFATSLGYVFFGSMINSLGEMSAAAHTVANTVESAFYVPGYGMQTAAATLMGNAIGERDERKMKRLSRTVVLFELALMIVSGGLLFAFAPQMASLFSGDAAVIGLASVVLRMVAVTEPFYGIGIVVEGMLQGAGKTGVPFVLNVCGMWLLRIFGTFIFVTVSGHGLVAAWSCMIVHNLFLFLSLSVYYLSGKWKKGFPLVGKLSPSGD